MIKRIVNFYKRNFWTCERYAREIGVKIGKNCSIGTIEFGSEPYLVTIGDYVQITKDVKFFCHGAAWVLRRENPNVDFFGKIKVGNNVYIGNNSLIMPGVTIGDNVIIAAGSVVAKTIPNDSIVGGNPAKIIGNVNEFGKRMKEFNLDSKKMSASEKRKFLLSLSEESFIKK